jgi:hypothetical protein
MEDNKIIIEELGRIKNLMGYDRSKTLNENINEADGIVDKVYRWLLPSGDIVKGTDIKGKIPKGSKLLNGVNAEKAVNVAGGATTASSLVGGETAAVAGAEVAAVGGVEAATVGTTAVAGEAATGTFLGLGPVGWTVLGVAGIAALGMWGLTKDDDMGMITRLFDMCKTSPDRKKWKRFLGDDEAKKLSGKLFHAMEGLGTNEDVVYKVFGSLKSPADFCKVSEIYEKSFGESLLEGLDSDFDYGWEPIATSLVDMTKNYAQSEAEDYCKKNPEECAKKLEEYCSKNPKDEKCKDVTKVGGGGEEIDDITYKTCDGTYNLGCKDDEDDEVYALQSCLGVNKSGEFDKKTEESLKTKTGKTSITKREIWALCDEFNRNN